MFIYAGNNLKNYTNEYQGIVQVPVVPLPICCYHGLSYIEKADIVRDKTATKGLQLLLHLQGSGNMFLNDLLCINSFLIDLIYLTICIYLQDH